MELYQGTSELIRKFINISVEMAHLSLTPRGTLSIMIWICSHHELSMTSWYKLLKYFPKVLGHLFECQLDCFLFSLLQNFH
jgi:hypothetical protein